MPATKPEVHNPEVITKVDISGELEAIRNRLAARRRHLYGAGGGGASGSAGPFNTTDLADAEWLLVELDNVHGRKDRITPAETYELDALNKKRTLSPVDQTVLDKISGKHGELTAEDLVMREHLTIKQDGMLTLAELERFKVLTEKASPDKASPEKPKTLGTLRGKFVSQSGEKSITLSHETGPNTTHSVPATASIGLNNVTAKMSDFLAGDTVLLRGEPVTSVSATR